MLYMLGSILRFTLKFTLELLHFNVNFNVNFNVLARKYIVHPLVKKKGL
jgi:hypothetical protein